MESVYMKSASVSISVADTIGVLSNGTFTSNATFSEVPLTESHKTFAFEGIQNNTTGVLYVWFGSCPVGVHASAAAFKAAAYKIAVGGTYTPPRSHYGIMYMLAAVAGSVHVLWH